MHLRRATPPPRQARPIAPPKVAKLHVTACPALSAFSAPATLSASRATVRRWPRASARIAARTGARARRDSAASMPRGSSAHRPGGLEPYLATRRRVERCTSMRTRQIGRRVDRYRRRSRAPAAPDRPPRHGFAQWETSTASSSQDGQTAVYHPRRLVDLGRKATGSTSHVTAGEIVDVVERTPTSGCESEAATPNCRNRRAASRRAERDAASHIDGRWTMSSSRPAGLPGSASAGLPRNSDSDAIAGNRRARAAPVRHAGSPPMPG